MNHCCLLFIEDRIQTVVNNEIIKSSIHRKGINILLKITLSSHVQ